MRRALRRCEPAWAPFVYLVAAAALTYPVLGHLASRYVGIGGDPMQMMWFLGWTPYALGHGLNPFLTNWLQQPGGGVNLTWNTSVPLLGTILWPVIAKFGPVVGYNVGMIMGPAISAWCAYLAARRFASKRGPAFLAGLIYGFSPMVIAQSLGHLNMVWMPIPPLLLIVCDELLHKQRAAPHKVGISLGLLLSAQYFIFAEFLATEVLMIVVATVIVAAASTDARSRVRLLYFGHAVMFGGICFLVISGFPLSVQLLGPWRPRTAVQPPGVYVADLLNFVVPDALQRVATTAMKHVSASFTGNMSEWDDYLGIPMIAVGTWAIVANWRVPIVRFFAAMLCVAAVFALGPSLHVGGLATRPMLPWALVQRLPLYRDVLPTRLGMYTYLALAMLVAIHLSRDEGRSRVGTRSAWIVVAIALSSWLPRVPLPTTQALLPPFFEHGGGNRLTGVALVLPYPDAGHDQPMLWQAESNYAFKLIGGRVAAESPAGPSLARFIGVIYVMRQGSDVGANPVAIRYTRDLLVAEHVSEVLVGPSRFMGQEDTLVTAALGHPPSKSGGILLWRIVTGTGSS